MHDRVCSMQDEYYTPLYVILPIAEYIKPKSKIWCPFDTEQSLYARYFRSKGYEVVTSHINEGKDFFKIEPPLGTEYIISNPPYSKKDLVFERLFNLGIPFAMLVNITGLFAAKSRFELFKDSVELMVFNARVQYMKSYENKKTTTHPPFESGYVCSGVLPDKLVFKELDKSKIIL